MEWFERLGQYFASEPKGWTKAESIKLLLTVHIDRQSPIKALGRTRADCEGQYKALYGFALQQIITSEGNFNPVESYYKEVKDTTRIDTDQEPWSKEETLVLFDARQRGVPHRTRVQCFHHYYDVAGIVFRKLRQDLSLEEALLRAVDEFYKVRRPNDGSAVCKNKWE